MHKKAISFEEIEKKLDDAPEGYVPRECYEAAKMRADRLEEMWRAEHKELKMAKGIIETICMAINAFNNVITKEDDNDKGRRN